MTLVINDNIYDINLINEIKKQTGPKAVKKIRKQLRNFIDLDIENFNASNKVKVVDDTDEKKIIENNKKIEFKNNNPIIDFNHYFEDSNKQNTKDDINFEGNYKGENTPSTLLDVEGEVDKIGNSYFSSND